MDPNKLAELLAIAKSQGGDFEQSILEIAEMYKTEEPSEQIEESVMLEVAKTKGLPAPDGGVLTKYFGMSVSRGAMTSDDVETKGAKGSKKKKAEDYHPTDEELSKINELSNVDYEKGQVYVFTLRSADMNVDRSSDQFTNKALQDMAKMSPDKPYLRDHKWDTKNVIGKIFDAGVSNKSLMQKVYVPITSKNEDVIEGMMSGLLNKVSVGFSMNANDYICSSCSKSLYSMDCDHFPGYADEKGMTTVGQIKGVKDYFEISNVAVPAQPAAGIRRNDTKSLETESVDKITLEQLPGEESVEETNKSVEEVVTEEVIAAPEVVAEVPTEEVAKSADEVVEAPVVEKSVSEQLKEVMDAFLSVATELKAATAELKASIESKSVVEQSAIEESTEEIARKLAATGVASEAPAQGQAPAPNKVDFTKSGWSSAVTSALFKKNQ